MSPELESEILMKLGELSGEVKGIHSRLDRFEADITGTNDKQDKRIEYLEKKCVEAIIAPASNVSRKDVAATGSVSALFGGAIMALISWLTSGRLPWGG